MVTATTTVATVALVAAASLLSVTTLAIYYGTKTKKQLEASLAVALEKCAAERRGRVRAHQALRKVLLEKSPNGLITDAASSGPPTSAFPMVPIGTISSCFSTRNGTPRQPLLVPLARARLVFDQTRVPAEALEGLADYSHCWIIYVFHLNTDLEKLWKEPARSKFKAKVRVPRLKGGKMGVLATRSPHRPCPIGLTVAKVEALDRHSIVLSGVDLVDGTPVLDIKPYLPYSDCIDGATVPDWVKDENALAVTSVKFSPDFLSSLSNCWSSAGEHSLYDSIYEFQSLIKEVLSWDIRSLSQRSRSHHVRADSPAELDNQEDETDDHLSHMSSVGNVVYHLLLEGIDISYELDNRSNVIVDKATLIGKRSSKKG